MRIKTYVGRLTMSRAAARHAAQALRDAIAARGAARIVAATGASQFDFLGALTAAPAIDWTRVEMFHLDEYVGLAIDHPTSFRKYIPFHRSDRRRAGVLSRPLHARRRDAPGSGPRKRFEKDSFRHRLTRSSIGNAATFARRAV